MAEAIDEAELAIGGLHGVEDAFAGELDAAFDFLGALANQAEAFLGAAGGGEVVFEGGFELAEELFAFLDVEAHALELVEGEGEEIGVDGADIGKNICGGHGSFFILHAFRKAPGSSC